MKVQLRHHETKEILNLEFSDACTLHDLRLQINESDPSSVHLFINRNDEFLAASSSQATLRSLGVTSGDFIYYSLDPSASSPFDREPESESFAEASVGESSTGGKLTENETLVKKSETNQAIVSDSMSVVPQKSILNLDIQNQANTETNPGAGGSLAVTERAEPKDDDVEDLSVSVGESSAGGRLTENATLVQESETNQGIVSDSVSVIPKNSVVNLDIQKNQANTEMNLVLENAVMEGAEPKDDVGRERLSEPLFLEKILFEESGDTSELTTVVMTVHAVMLESRFLLFDPDPAGMRFSFSEELFSITLTYTLPALTRDSEEHNNAIESVRLKFQRLGHMVVVYGSLGSSSNSVVRRLCFDKRRYVRIVDLLMETLKPDDKEDTLSINRSVFMCWRRIKDGLVTPLLIDLCYKTGLEIPPCLMSLPRELKLKILKSLHGLYVARMACVSSEFRDLASDNALWKGKCLEVCSDLVTQGDDDVVTWKDTFATYWREHGFSNSLFARLSSYFGNLTRRGRKEAL